jgi:type IV pilus assembly protein PilO
MDISDLNELDFSNVAGWPLPIKLIAILLLCAAVIGAGYWFDTQEQIAALESSQAKEKSLKQTFESKQAIAANLNAYRLQMKEMEQGFGALLLKLPGKTEIAELLVDISRVGLQSGLEFELFKPGAEIPKDFYAEYPISIRVTGSYHQFGDFASGVAALPRIVTLHDFAISMRGKDSNMVMKATANTYRYLDKSERKKGKKGKKKRRR